MGFVETLRICEFIRVFLQQVQVVNYVYLMSEKQDSFPNYGILCGFVPAPGVCSTLYAGEGWYLFYCNGKLIPKHVEKRGDAYLEPDGSTVQGQLMGKISAYIIDGAFL